ncbi:MAG: M4 family metallopeptidase [Candidatus Hydrogenedentota bacterium]
MRGRVFAAVAAVVGLMCGGLATADTPQADPAAVQEVLGALRAAPAPSAPLIRRAETGHFHYLGAPPEGHFAVPGAAKGGTPERVAQAFLDTHAAAFGLDAANGALRVHRTAALDDRTVVRLRQYYQGVPVYGGEVVVQVGAGGMVQSVLSDVARDLTPVTTGGLTLNPNISSAAAAQTAREAVAGRNPGVPLASISVHKQPTLTLFSPTLLGLDGPMRLTWSLVAGADDVKHGVMETVLVDAHMGEEVFHFQYCSHAKNRAVFDLEGRSFLPDFPTRAEGQSPAGIEAVDNVYNFLGDTYDFYLENHGWDGLDNGQEGELNITAFVRLDIFNAFYMPYTGSSLSGTLWFGTGFGADDVVAHEYTHAVTQFTSDLVYQGYSGAIKESFSDIWGEYVDLTNGADDEEDRWIFAEDIAERLLEMTTPGSADIALRDMADPPAFGHPDRLNSPLAIDPDSAFDNGGAHINSGIGNKLCYLLTDGDSFNGETVEGFGITRTADLFWEAQNTLSPTADYFDLYYALAQGAVNLGFTQHERLNVAAACRAVEIVPEDQLAFLRAFPTDTTDGGIAVSLNWTSPPTNAPTDSTLLRSLNGFALAPEDGEVLFQDEGDKYLDRNVLPGVRYFYTLVQDLGDEGILQAFVTAEAGAPTPDALTEAFTARNPLDLDNIQLTFTPVGGANNSPLGDEAPRGFADYDVTVRRNVRDLPVARGTAGDNAHNLVLQNNDLVQFNLAMPFPFFGHNYKILYVSDQGYIAFEPVDVFSADNIPTLDAHFNVPRISFLFGNLSPDASGRAWYGDLEDRMVFTFEHIPETGNPLGNTRGNTAQVELFTNGQVRMTYLLVNIEEAVVGLSDGRGFPVSPADLFDDALGVIAQPDLSLMPTAAQRLRIEPVPVLQPEAGDVVTFDVETTAPDGAEDLPRLTAAWDQPGAAPFVDNGDGTGTFRWESDALFQEELVIVRVRALLGDEEAFQDVRISFPDNIVAPAAENVRIRTDNALEDPNLTRTIEPGQPLYVDYTYRHPLRDGGDNNNNNNIAFEEGDSIIRWYRNYNLSEGFTYSSSVPAGRVKSGERWQASVIPISRNDVEGEERFSPAVTVLAAPEVIGVQPAYSPVEGGKTVTISGRNLEGPIRVAFGGVEARSYSTLSDTEIEVVTPLRTAGTVSVTVETSRGVGKLANAFSYLQAADKIPNPDVNGDGKVDARDVQLVTRAILENSKDFLDGDTNGDGNVNAADVQVVVNAILRR